MMIEELWRRCYHEMLFIKYFYCTEIIDPQSVVQMKFLIEIRSMSFCGINSNHSYSFSFCGPFE